MAEIKIADKPTLDEVNAKSTAIQTGVGELQSDTDRLKSSAETIHETVTAISTVIETVNAKIGADSDSAGSGGKTLFSLIKYIVSMFTSYFTPARAARLDNIDVALSTRAAQTSVNNVQSEVAAVKSMVEAIGSTVSGGAAATKTALFYYAAGEIGTDGVLLTLNGAGCLRKIVADKGGVPVNIRMIADGALLDLNEGMYVSFSKTLSVVLEGTLITDMAVTLSVVYDMGV